MFCYSILQIPSVKQFTIKKSIEFINSKADFKISYEKFFYEDLKNISFSGITIENKNNHKELLKLQKIQVGINLFNLFLKRELNFKNLDFVDLVLLVDKNKNTFLNSKTEQIDFKLVNFFSIHVENINFINCAIVFDNDDFEKNPENFFDVNHFRIAEINSHLQKIIFSKDGISGSVKKFSASGDKILLKDLNLDAKYCNDKIKLEKIFIDSNYGKLSGNLEACNLNDQEKFNYTLDLQNLTVDAKKIPSLKSFDSEISLGCKVKGNLQDSFIQECRCFYKKNSLSFSGFVKNFVEREKLQYQIDKISGNFNLRSFPQIISSEIINMLPCKSGEFYGSLQGKSREGNLILNLQSAAGNISSNFNFANIFSQNLKFAGNIDLQKVNLKNFGITDINSNHEIKFSPEEKKLENKISELNYMDVNIKDIKCTIQGDEKNYFGFLKIDDKNLKTSLNFKNYDDIICCLGHCDLQNLNQFFKSEKNIIIKNDIDIKIKTKTNDISAIFSNNFLKFGANDFNLKTLKTDFERKKFFFTLNLFSDFGDIKIYDIPENVKDVKNIFLQFWENLYNWTENRELKISKDPNFKIPFYVNLKDDKIFSLLGQDVSCGCTNFYGEFLNVEGEKILTLNTDKIRNIKIEDKNFTNTDFSLTIGLNEKKNLPIFNVFCEIDKADSKDFFVDNIIFKIESQDKSINTHLTLKNNIFKFALNLKS
ncbi:MAG: hypothetical protein LBD32_01005, partial [Cytophagales bacterium]|nr:hypothetical protein [Cytophagales bacterium]